MVTATASKPTGAENVLWDLSVFYNAIDDPRIDSDSRSLEALVEDFALRYKGRVAQLSAEELVVAMRALEAIYDLRGRLIAYANLLYATDASNPQYGALVQRMTEMSARLSQKLVFFDLEWNALDDNQARAILDDSAIAEYRYYLDANRRFKPYQLSEIEEKLMLEKDVTGRNAWVRFFNQLTASMRYEYEGQQLTQSEVLNKLYDADRDTRHKAADSMTAGLRARSMELTYIFNVLLADKASNDQWRGYESWIKARNLSNKATDAMVEALISAVTASYELVARHYRVKRALLGYDALYDYDRYAPLPFQSEETFYPWDKAKDIILDAFHAFSPRMADSARQFFDGNWIHAPVLPNKRGGAFANPTVKSAHPFVFVNYLGTADNVMTLAHELGHGVHMLLSRDAQNLFGLYTPLTTAEMASVFAEMLVFQDLMAKQGDKAAQLAMLSKKLEDTFATVYRQTAMNRFEDAIHTARRLEGELTTERISDFWMKTQRAMFGDSVTLRDDYGIWWSYVGHFIHTPGYVYAYAFGELLVLALYQLYVERGADFVPQYIELLAAGDSDYPDKLLARVGVDLNDPDFWHKGVDAIRRLVEDEERLAHSLFPNKF